MKTFRAFVILCLLAQTALASGRDFGFGSIFTDSMVVLQKSQVPFWGWGPPGSLVTLRASWGAKGQATADSAGKWITSLRSPAAGGPFTVTGACGDTAITLADVMSGEVWLASGQSNMEMPLEGWPPRDTVANFSEVIRGSANPLVRFFTVKRAVSGVAEESCAGRWVTSSPANAPQFSAAAYFFARKIQQTLKIPVGIVHASWGGTPIEAWISGGALSPIAEFDSTLKKLEAGRESNALLNAWLHQFPSMDMSVRLQKSRWTGLSFDDDSCPQPSYNDSLWRTMNLPVLWEQTGLGNFDGVVWFRREVRIPSSWVKKQLVLELGPIDDIDVTYLNGVRIGGYEGEGFWNTPRVYPVPDSIVTDSVLHVAVRVIDYQGGGGIYGKKDMMCVYPAINVAGPGPGSTDRVSLAGEWRYLPVAELRGNVLYQCGAAGQPFLTRPHLAVDINPSMPTTLYNGMISPVVPYAIRGAIWYQGESNVGRAQQYRRLFPLMIEDWREKFRSPAMSFYYVQIAPYTYDPGSNSQLLREAQMNTLKVPHTGMAVTLDIGNNATIHPADKLDVGERLARWALAKDYRKNVAFSGPSEPRTVRHKGYIDIVFGNAAKGLVMKEIGGKNGFSIAGADSVFKDARVEIRGNRVRVFSPGISFPLAVRYAFTDTSMATLFNKEGLPASSFRTDDWAK